MKTMKKYSILLSATLAILALASCQKEQEVVNEETPNAEVIDNTPTSVPFVLRADIPSVNSEEPSGPETKTTLNTSTWAVDWESTDVIYAVTTDKAWGQDYADDKSGDTIAEFAYDSEKGSFSTNMAIADGNHTFNFLYTASPQKSYHRGGSTTFQLYGTQTFDASDPTANLKLYDALAAQVTATTPTTFADVDMSHLFTLMKVTLKNKTGASVNITKFEIEIPGEDLYGIFDVTFGTTPSAAYNRNGGDKITINISNGTVANGASLDVYFVMGAVSGYTGEVTFKVTDSADNTYTKTNTINAPGVTFAAGTYNTANYSLKTMDPPTVTSWVETAIGSLSAGDIVAIVDKKSSRAMTNNNGTSSAPAASAVTISGSNITSTVADNIQWVFEIPSAGNYSFKVPGSSNYLYTTNSNNGVRVGTNANKVFTLSTKWLKNNETGRYVGVYNEQDWRCYDNTTGNISGTVTAFYKKTDVAVASHTISITSPSNGTVVTSPASTAYESATVTITATPNDGYAVSAVSVVDASSNTVTTTPVDATHFTFTMPSDDVTVTVTFARVYTITATATNGSIEISPSTTALAGETITITATPNSGYAFDSWSVTGATPASTTTNPTTFTMPASDVSVIATFAIAKTITRLVASIDDVPAAGVSGEIEAGVYSLTNAVEGDLNVTYDGTVVTGAINDNGSVMYDVAANTGAVRSGWIKIAVAGGNEIEIEVNQLAGTVDYSSTYTSNVTLATGTSAQEYTLEISGTEYSGVKAGTSNNGGSMTFSIPSGTTRITLHAQGWGTDTPSVNITSASGTVSPSSFSPAANNEYSGNGTTFTITTSASDYYVFNVAGVTSKTTVTLSTSSKKSRFVVWGVNVD